MPESTLEGQEYEEGQIPDAEPEPAPAGAPPPGHQFWRDEDESFYSNGSTNESGGGRWSYPANFEDAIMPVGETKKKKKTKVKKDRFARTEDAYSLSEESGKKKKKKKNRSTVGGHDGYNPSNTSFDEDGGHPGGSNNGVTEDIGGPGPRRDELEHEF